MATITSIALHNDLAQAAPAVALGTLQWQMSKFKRMACDGLKVLIIFFITNLVMAAWRPTRSGQLRAPLVEQRVPDVEAAGAAARGAALLSISASPVSDAGVCALPAPAPPVLPLVVILTHPSPPEQLAGAGVLL